MTKEDRIYYARTSGRSDALKKKKKEIKCMARPTSERTYNGMPRFHRVAVLIITSGGPHARIVKREFRERFGNNGVVCKLAN